VEVSAFVNGMVQIGVIFGTVSCVKDARQRQLVLALAGASETFSVAGLLLLMFPTLPQLTEAAKWLLYAAIGLAVVVGVVTALRSQRTRFAWPQGRYHKYRSYRRI